METIKLSSSLATNTTTNRSMYINGFIVNCKHRTIVKTGRVEQRTTKNKLDGMFCPIGKTASIKDRNKLAWDKRQPLNYSYGDSIPTGTINKPIDNNPIKRSINRQLPIEPVLVGAPTKEQWLKNQPHQQVYKNDIVGYTDIETIYGNVLHIRINNLQERLENSSYISDRPVQTSKNTIQFNVYARKVRLLHSYKCFFPKIVVIKQPSNKRYILESLQGKKHDMNIGKSPLHHVPVIEPTKTVLAIDNTKTYLQDLQGYSQLFTDSNRLTMVKHKETNVLQVLKGVENKGKIAKTLMQSFLHNRDIVKGFNAYTDINTSNILEFMGIYDVSDKAWFKACKLGLDVSKQVKTSVRKGIKNRRYHGIEYCLDSNRKVLKAQNRLILLSYCREQSRLYGAKWNKYQRLVHSNLVEYANSLKIRKARVTRKCKPSKPSK